MVSREENYFLQMHLWTEASVILLLLRKPYKNSPSIDLGRHPVVWVKNAAVENRGSLSAASHCESYFRILIII